MIKTIDQIIEDVIVAEGDEYTNDPNDAGGPTKFGITLETLRAYRKNPAVSASDVQRLTKDEARRIYRNRYFVDPGFVHVHALMPRLAAEVVDAGVNCGTGRAARWLQTALNAFNRSYRVPADWPELVVDGRIGPATLGALSAFAALRGKSKAERVLTRAVDCQQGVHYLTLGANRPSQESFMLGWFDHRIG